MSRFSVSTGQVATTADLLQGLLHDLGARLDVANASVSGVVGASWTGDAADEFASAWQGLLTDAAAVQVALTSLVARMRAAEGGYEQVEVARTAVAQTAASAIGTSTGQPGASPDGEPDGRREAS
ncbi:WXG100 family type VII secretion target [Demequina subtropica]|uniref:WXG100 family type VII secretion target n=1 Tax=Demequina subtropica TaxID=1638989 RepID=UPI000782AC2D|nr:WXG100 family type VII secretion target [Demequina subtropica]